MINVDDVKDPEIDNLNKGQSGYASFTNQGNKTSDAKNQNSSLDQNTKSYTNPGPNIGTGKFGDTSSQAAAPRMDTSGNKDEKDILGKVDKNTHNTMYGCGSDKNLGPDFSRTASTRAGGPPTSSGQVDIKEGTAFGTQGSGIKASSGTSSGANYGGGFQTGEHKSKDNDRLYNTNYGTPSGCEDKSKNSGYGSIGSNYGGGSKGATGGSSLDTDQSKDKSTHNSKDTSSDKGIYDQIKDMASQAKDKVSEAIGVDQSEKGITGKLSETMGKVTDTLTSAAEKLGLKSSEEHQNKDKKSESNINESKKH